MSRLSAKIPARFIFSLLVSLRTIAATTNTDALPQSVVPAILLVAPRDSAPIDSQIYKTQLRLKRTALPGPELERLGWLFIAKARTSSDPGYVTLAAIAADTLERNFGLQREAWLMRGHVMQSRHAFAAAEQLARRLVALGGAPADYALLGDALYDQGRITDAAAAYQRMVDLKPSLDSYARAANIRWIKGDLAGALQLQTMAVRSGDPNDPGALAWSLVRLGQFVWQQGDATSANALAMRALELVPEFQPALLLQGRVLLAANRAVDALIPLAQAAEILPLPEPRWAYADALRAADRNSEADELERRLVREGVSEDPRTVALFLATQGRDSATAVRLAMAELNTRSDVLTHSAAALALADAGCIGEAVTHEQAARVEGTADARILLHAARVAVLARQADAADLLKRAQQLAHLLLPSERRLLDDSFTLLRSGAGPTGNTNQNTQQKIS